MNSSQETLEDRPCHFSGKFSVEAKNSLRKEVCGQLLVDFEVEGLFYCVLHFPDKKKHTNTNFIAAVEEKLSKQENNYCGVFFPGKTTYFADHIFETETLFERAVFEHAVFTGAVFNDTASFSFAELNRANFSGSKFHKQSFFLETILAIEAPQYDHPPILNFSGSYFANAIFQYTHFNKEIHFNDAIFLTASFRKSKFNGANFFSTNFKEHIDFDGADFAGSTTFQGVIFDCDEKAKISAKKKSFHINASFDEAIFEDVTFRNVTF